MGWYKVNYLLNLLSFEKKIKTILTGWYFVFKRCLKTYPSLSHFETIKTAIWVLSFFLPLWVFCSSLFGEHGWSQLVSTAWTPKAGRFLSSELFFRHWHWPHCSCLHWQVSLQINGWMLRSYMAFFTFFMAWSCFMFRG